MQELTIKNGRELLLPGFYGFVVVNSIRNISEGGLRQRSAVRFWFGSFRTF